jgi:[ribosomal protein S18]-alanine N-acetyltransferase
MNVVRLATRADAAEIAAMSRDEIERGLPWSWTEARVLRAIRDPDINVAVIGEQGKLVAFGIMSYREVAAHLLLFSVRPGNRRQGVGGTLLDWLEAVATNAGIPRIDVECRRDNAVARNFYSDHGYHELTITKGYYRGVEDAIRLEKHLGATP